jgi:hypothetical protein
MPPAGGKEKFAGEQRRLSPDDPTIGSVSAVKLDPFADGAERTVQKAEHSD